MQAIEQHPYVAQVLATLPGEAGLGRSLEDDPALEFLDNEIMKVGSLAHTGIEWARVEREALRLLSDCGKDLKVLGFLMLCLQRGGNGERFGLSLYLLHRVLDSWWSRARPYPGERGKRARRMLFGQILQRAAGEVEAISFDGAVGDGRSYCLDLLARLEAQAADQDLPAEGLASLARAVRKLPEAGQAGVSGRSEEKDPRDGPGPAPEPAATGVASASLASVTIDTGNERATRQSLLRVADLLTETAPGNALGYQLRRHAIWHAIAAVPPARDGKRTDLAAVSADRVADYREALARGPDLGLWQRIEQSLSVSPFWLEGHWLSAQAATALGHDTCAEAIRASLAGFLERLPDLAGMTFTDGTPFLPSLVAEWLTSSPARGTGEGSGQLWEQAFQQAREELQGPGLGVAMQRLDEGLAKAREPRDRFYWRLMSADLLREAGLKTLAQQQVRDLRDQVRELALDQWEPALLARLERLA